MDSAAVPEARARIPWLGAAWPLVLGVAALAIPTAVRLGQDFWSRDDGAHGPIILATGGWLIYRQLPDLKAHGRPGSPVVTGVMLIVALAAYVFGRAYDFMTLEAGGLYGVGLAVMHALVGPRMMRRTWFPLLYLAFAVPPPQFLLDAITAPLKQLVSGGATSMLSALGFPVSRQGVLIFIANYELLVEDACSGMNSLVGLTAIGLLYIYLMRGSSWVRAALLVACVLPIAILANLVRITVLVLITYFFGNDAAQGFVHGAAGIVLFGTALAMVFAADRLMSLVLDRNREPT